MSLQIKSNNKLKSLKIFGLIVSVLIVLVGFNTFTVKAQTFSSNLSQGSHNSEVKALQQFLNTHGFPIALSGPGSLGNETDYFGKLTTFALIKFQEFYANQILKPLGLSKGTGIFGAATRNFIKSLISQSSTTPPQLNFSGLPPSFSSSSPLNSSSSTQANFTPNYFSYGGWGEVSSGGGANVNPSSISPTITFNDLTASYGDANFSLSPTSNSSGSFTFTSSDPTVATISGNMVTIVGVGTTTITAIQSASGNFTSGSASATLTVNKEVPSLIYGNHAVDFLTVAEVESGDPFPLTIGSIPDIENFPESGDDYPAFYLVSGNPILFSVNSVNGLISALQNLDASISPSYTLTIGLGATHDSTAVTASTTITVINPDDCSPNPCQYGGTCGGGFDGQGTGSFTCSCPSGLTGTTCSVAVDECADNPCQNGGTCTRTSTLGGSNPPLNSYECTCNSGYGGTNCNLTVPTINFSLATTTSDVGSITLSPTSNSSGSFSFTSSNTSVATVSGSTATITGTTGTSTITAIEAANGSYSTGTATSTLVVVGACDNGDRCNGNGTCEDGFASFTCICNSGWVGTTCNIAQNPAAYNYNQNTLPACFETKIPSLPTNLLSFANSPGG